jgi:predicted enzyme related to lactoylglutathione lyase
MEVFKTHGAFSWSELMTTDPAATTAFYGQLFGWTVDTMDMGTGPYHVVKVGDTAVGGVMGIPPDGPPMPPHWGSYVTVSNVDQTAARCAELGGQVMMPPMDIPKVGRMAVLADPQGAVLSVMQYSME